MKGIYHAGMNSPNPYKVSDKLLAKNGDEAVRVILENEVVYIYEVFREENYGRLGMSRVPEEGEITSSALLDEKDFNDIIIRSEELEYISKENIPVEDWPVDLVSEEQVRKAEEELKEKREAAEA